MCFAPLSSSPQAARTEDSFHWAQADPAREHDHGFVQIMDEVDTGCPLQTVLNRGDLEDLAFSSVIITCRSCISISNQKNKNISLTQIFEGVQG